MWTESTALRGGSELRAVAAISRNNVWTVGSSATTGPLAEHFNGTSWSAFDLPDPNKRTGSELNAVSASSANDVWAVGWIGPHTHTLIEHFNGKAWRVAPSLQTPGTKLMGVAAVTRRNAWAVGALAVKTKNSRPLIEHWNGSSWRRVPSPDPRGPEDELLAISARSPRDIWAVGDHRAGNHTRTLVLHWDGRRWKQVPSPSPAAEDSSLWGVTVVGAKDAWAVGVGGNRSLAEHWNGHAWRVVSVRSPAGSTANSLLAVSGSSPTDVWAAGQDGYGAAARGLVEHWDGHAWSYSRTGAAGYVNLSGIAAPSASDVWAVGARTPLVGLR